MEVIIAIGLGSWFAIAGLLSSLAVSKSFKEKKKNEEQKGKKQ